MVEQTKGKIQMKVKSVKSVGKKQVYDISVAEAEHYVLENGVVSHNTGLMYSANQAFIISKSQEKDGGELSGWNFTLNVEKSRYVREKAKLPFLVTYESGIQKYSGLLDLALESGHVIKPSNGWYQLVDTETGELIGGKVRAKETQTEAFLGSLLTNQKFKDFVSSKYKLVGGSHSLDEDSSNSLSDIEDEDA